MSAAIGPRVFVYGSCVSRDAFNLDGAPVLVEYIARSALGSAFAPAPAQMPDGFDLANNPSKFQQRMVQTDVEKGLAKLLTEADFDVLLLDLIDERFEMAPVGGSWVTYSSESMRCGLPNSPRVRVGSDEYWTLFDAGLERLVETVGANRIVLNRVAWATHTKDGDELLDQPSIKRHNDALTAAYARLDARGVRSIHYAPNILVADPAHKWGIGPFHYAEGFYRETVRALVPMTG